MDQGNQQPASNSGAGQEDYADKGTPFPSTTLHSPFLYPAQTHYPYSTFPPKKKHLIITIIPPILTAFASRNPPSLSKPLSQSFFFRDNIAKSKNDPGLDAVEKKFGQGKIDPEKQRGMNEKVTDGARGMFEKATGYVLLFCCCSSLLETVGGK